MATAKRTGRKKWKVILLILLVGFAGIQFIRPSLDNPPVTSDLAAPAEVKALLQKACYDCHSNETKLKWFDQVAPAYWLVADHVKEGRSVLNFSTMGQLPAGDRKAKLYESVNQMMTGDMPLSSYTTFHCDAKLSPADIQAMQQYLLGISPAVIADTALIQAADKQYAQWNAETPALTNVQAAPNGIAYVAGYQQWSPISFTDRFDNNTMRVIFGNAIAVQAIKDKHTNPWPDGTVFAKVAWDQLADSAGHVKPGAFKQVEFMIKDTKKYDTSYGWGFARWKGMQLTPYGKNAGFANECMGCHKPMQDNDYVFTIPLESIPTGKIVTTMYDRNLKTMSAVYQQNNALSKVTWQQRDDPHWFGGRIPASPLPPPQGGGVSSVTKQDSLPDIRSLRRLVMP